MHVASPDAAFPRPSGDYSLHIATVAARATANKTMMYYVPTLMAISMVIAMRQYYKIIVHTSRNRGGPGLS